MSENLKPNKPWHPIQRPSRSDFLAWREADDGIEILVYNYAMWQTIDPMSQFGIERASSLASVSLPVMDYSAGSEIRSSIGLFRARTVLAAQMAEALDSLLDATTHERCDQDCRSLNCPWLAARVALAAWRKAND